MHGLIFFFIQKFADSLAVRLSSTAAVGGAATGSAAGRDRKSVV